MKTPSLKRMAATVTVAAAAMVPMLFNPANAPAQGGGSPIAGTWSSVVPDGQGGQLYTYFIYGQDGSYKMVSIIQGGPHNGSETQRWGTYQWQQTGQNQGIATVHVTGGAPQQVCTQGSNMPCTQVRGIQQNARYQLRVQGNQLTDGQGVFNRDQVPQQLMSQLPPTRYVQPPIMPRPNPSPSPNPKGGSDCPGDLQQDRICTINDGVIHINSQGCKVCVKNY